MPFQVTPAHQAIFDLIDDPHGGNAIISAVAGSGKTSTLLEVLKRLDPRLDILFLAFNRKIALELTARAPQYVQCMTLNGLGHRALTQHLAGQGIKPKLDKNPDYKTNLLGREIYGEDDWRPLRGKVGKLVRLAKSSGLVPDGFGPTLVPDTLASWEGLADRYDVFDADANRYHVERCLEAARRVHRASVQRLDVIDFDDQLLMTYALGAEMPKFDWVFLDEAQDCNPLQHELTARTMRAGTRFVAVGDERQAIYAFRGADSQSMATLGARFNCTKLPLHASYRCAKSVVAEAQKYVGHIQACATAPEGTVVREGLEPEKAGIRAGDMVVSRTSAPMVSCAFTLLRMGIPAVIMGRDIGSNLIKLLDKMAPTSLADAARKIEDWEQRETAKAIAKEDEAKQAAIQDKAEVLRAFLDASESPEDMRARIEAMFSDDSPANVVTCCTIHKSKGLEAERVHVLNIHKMPSKWARQPWQLEQEDNLAYVAVTRAKTYLQYVTVGDRMGKGAPVPRPAQAPGAAQERAQRQVPVTGNTYPVREQLKAMEPRGTCRWDAAKKQWTVPADRLEEAQAIVAGKAPRPALRLAAKNGKAV